MIEDPAHISLATDDGKSRPMHEPLPRDSAADDVAAGEHHQHITATFDAKAYHWKNQPLAPFAISREGDWRQHRAALGAPPLEELIFKPEAMIPDALRVLWFLSHEPREWLSIPAMRQDDQLGWHRRGAQEMALELEAKIRAWADENIDGDEYALAVGLFYDIFNRTRETRTTVRPDKHHDPERAKN